MMKTTYLVRGTYFSPTVSAGGRHTSKIVFRELFGQTTRISGFARSTEAPACCCRWLCKSANCFVRKYSSSRRRTYARPQLHEIAEQEQRLTCHSSHIATLGADDSYHYRAVKGVRTLRPAHVFLADGGPGRSIPLQGGRGGGGS